MLPTGTAKTVNVVSTFNADLGLCPPSDITSTRRTLDTSPGDHEAVSVPFPFTVPVTGGGAEKVPQFFRVSTTGS